ncbi:MAG: aminoglycoside phosphotransferase family protein [Eubacteriales bacterium]|nr:aminoglycoside phosphotransferase family protein [Eubacteriales bacterium]
MNAKLRQVCEAFRIQGTYQSYEEIKIGNVNQTYKVNYLRNDGKKKSYIVQAVNTYVFKNPVQVMENIDKVTAHIHAKKPNQTSLHFHHTTKRKTYLFDENGFWRLFNYIPSTTYNATQDMRIIRNAGEAFGEFQMLLADFDAAQLYETIPDFHNTKKRYEKLEANAAADPCGRVQVVRDELNWLISVKEQACRMTELYEQDKLPLRVTHNDTKINNVLFDSKSGDALVVIDLDTVMPGLVGHDFGDAIRFAANFVEEDSPDSAKAGINMEVFRAFADGFLSQTASALTEMEIDTLALSCFVLAVELSTRFLDDYILGDPYFKINYSEHNLVRTRCQIALAKDMLKHMDEMNGVVKNYAVRTRAEG